MSDKNKKYIVQEVGITTSDSEEQNMKFLLDGLVRA